MGWPKESIPRLVDIFWEFKDRDGNLKGESPSLETGNEPASRCLGEVHWTDGHVAQRRGSGHG
jgi:hypothetical protein